jgi:hypothetical protein
MSVQGAACCKDARKATRDGLRKSPNHKSRRYGLQAPKSSASILAASQTSFTAGVTDSSGIVTCKLHCLDSNIVNRGGPPWIQVLWDREVGHLRPRKRTTASCQS